MNKWKGLALLFSLLSLSSIQETIRILTSSGADIADNRSSLIPIAVIITGLFIFLAVRFWGKSSNSKRY